MSKSTYNYKRHAYVAARELGYSSKILEKIRNAETEDEIRRIMTNARKGE